MIKRLTQSYLKKTNLSPVGRNDASAIGGHILNAHVWPTLELVVEESPERLRRKSNPETGLPLLDL